MLTFETLEHPSSGEVADAWAQHGLGPADARRRGADTFVVGRDGTGAVVAASAPFSALVAPVGRRLWVHRTTASVTDRALFDATFDALAGRALPDGPQGLALVAEPDPDAPLADDGPHTVHAGFLPDGRQVRVAWFPGARVGDGDAPGVTDAFELDPAYDVAGARPADADALVALWTTQAELPAAEARRRVPEALLVAHHGTDVAAVCTAYLAFQEQVRLPMWHYRLFVARGHRRSNLASALVSRSREALSARWAAGDRRAPGIAMEVQSPVLKHRVDEARWPRADATFVGTLPDGAHLRVHWFPGATLRQGST